jgi:hypothetical protein
VARLIQSQQQNVVTEKLVNIRELSPKNLYEAQVLSTFTDMSGIRMESYQIPGGANSAFGKELEDSKVQFFDKCDNYFTKKTYKSHSYKTVFDVDFYFKPKDSNFTGSVFLQNAVETLKQMTVSDKLDIDINESNETSGWFFLEITQGPQHLAQKLWQLERATRVLTSIDESYSPRAVAVLLNGDKTEFDEALSKIRIPENFLIKQIPVYVGWVSTRNIFRSFSDLKQTVDLKFAATDNRIDKLNDKVDLKFAATDNRIDKLNDKVDLKFAATDNRIDKLFVVTALSTCVSFLTFLTVLQK